MRKTMHSDTPDSGVPSNTVRNRVPVQTPGGTFTRRLRLSPGMDPRPPQRSQVVFATRPEPAHTGHRPGTASVIGTAAPCRASSGDTGNSTSNRLARWVSGTAGLGAAEPAKNARINSERSSGEPAEGGAGEISPGGRVFLEYRRGPQEAPPCRRACRRSYRRRFSGSRKTSCASTTRLNFSAV